jgi:hypothetical protein
MPRCAIGADLWTVDCGELTVRGITDAPIAWPYAIRGNRRSLCLCGDLVVAVRLETVIGVSLWWGVSRTTACLWRRALGVPRLNPGTFEVWRLGAGKLMKGRKKASVGGIKRSPPEG